MEDYLIMFPSYGREKVLSTMQFVPADKVVVAVDADPVAALTKLELSQHFIDIPQRLAPTQRELYRAALPPETHILVVVPNGIGGIRWQMLDWAMNQPRAMRHRWLFMLEDDIEGIFKRQGLTAGGNPRLVPCGWEEMAESMIQYAKFNNVVQLGPSQRQSNWNYTERTYHNAAKITEASLLDLAWLSAKGVNYDKELVHWEDYDLTLQILSKGGKAGLYLPYAFTHADMGSNAGGHQAKGRNKESMAPYLKIMVDKWPGIVSTELGRLWPQPKIKWAAFREKASHE